MGTNYLCNLSQLAGATRSEASERPRLMWVGAARGIIRAGAARERL